MNEKNKYTRMIKKYLYRFGILKINKDEYLSAYKRVLNNVSKEILYEKNDSEKFEFFQSEVNIWLFVIGYPILKKKLHEDLLKDTFEYFKNEIAFSGIEKIHFKDGNLEKLLQNRIEFHSNGLSNTGEMDVLNNYWQKLFVLFFYKPYLKDKDLNEATIMYIGLSNQKAINNQIKTLAIYKTYKPLIYKYLIGLTRMVDKG